MTDYNRTTWVGGPTGTEITADRLNNLEDGNVKSVRRGDIPIRFAAAVALTGVTPTDRAYRARTLVGARMRVASAPAGSALTAQVQHFDGSTWTTISTLSIAAGSTVEAVNTFTQAQAVGDLLRINTTSIGTTTAATGVVVDVLIQE